MSFASKRNKGYRFAIDTTDFQFYKVRDLKDDEVYRIYGVVNFKTKYGDSPTAILSDRFVSLPKHMSDEIFEILADADDIKAINEGLVGIKKRPYIGRDGREYVGIDWVDIK